MNSVTLLKEKLLNLDIVIDNEYLDKYCDLIELNRETKKEKFKTQTHHIIPRCYYNHNETVINNSKNNLVNLSYKNHVLVHYYLVKCAKTSWFYYSCLCAITKMLTTFKELNEKYNILNDEIKFIELLESQEHLIEESYKLRSEKLKECVWMSNGKQDLLVSKEFIDCYLNNGWTFGRTYKMSDETKEKISLKLRGRHHTTSEETKRKIGESNKISLKGHKLSESAKLKLSKTNSNRTFYNNGIDNIFIKKDEQPPEGYIKGMIINHVDKEDWIRRVHKDRKSEDYNTTGGKIVINNTKNNKYIDEKDLQIYLDNGWKRGKLPIGKLNWYNNGIKNTRAYSCPDGYVEGRLLTDEVRYSLGNGSRNKFKK